MNKQSQEADFNISNKAWFLIKSLQSFQYNKKLDNIAKEFFEIITRAEYPPSLVPGDLEDLPSNIR